jgi:small subunit ribosomal protein S4
MGRYLGSSCKHCRREGVKLMLKGIRCETAKCPVEKKQRNLAPGMHGWRRGRASEFGVRLREKQKIKRYYGILEKQFMRCYRRAEKGKGNTGEALLQLLERRLDNVVYKLNFSPSRKAARQLIAHGHVYVNGRKVDISDYTTKIGDKITLKGNSKSVKKVKEQLERIRILLHRAGYNCPEKNLKLLLLLYLLVRMFRSRLKNSWLLSFVQDK